MGPICCINKDYTSKEMHMDIAVYRSQTTSKTMEILFNNG